MRGKYLSVVGAFWLCLGLLSLTACERSGSSKNSESELTYQVLAAPFPQARYVWCDNHHLAASVPEYTPRERGRLWYIDSRQPEKKRELDFKLPDQETLRLSVVSCDAGELVFVSQSPEPKPRQRWYRAKLDETASATELIDASDFGYAQLNQKGNYALQAEVMLPESADKPTSGCRGKISTALRNLCWPKQGNSHAAYSRYVVQKQVWEDRYSSRDEDGQMHYHANPLPRQDNSIWLKDLEQREIARLDQDPQFETDNFLFYTVDPAENYLYTPCKRKGKSNFTEDNDKVCRYPLDGKAHQWQEVLSFAYADKVKSGIQHISIDQQGNLYFDLPGGRGNNGGIWRYEASTHQIKKIVHGIPYHVDTNPNVSADGKTLVFERNGLAYIAQLKESAP